MIFDIHWWLSLTPHQLDVVRTIATIIGSAFLPLLGFLLGWGIRLLRRIRHEAAGAKANTESSVWVDGEQHVVPVIDHIEAAAQETRDGFAWVKGSGRYRSMTQDVPRVTMSNHVPSQTAHSNAAHSNAAHSKYLTGQPTDE